MPVLTTPPPKVPTQNTPKQSWEANRKVWKAYADLGWFKNQEIEPYMPNNGKSILVRWLNEDDKGISWTCCAPLDNEEHGCGHEPFRRLDRAIAHVRGHLGLEPFPCKEGCGNEGWYVPNVFGSTFSHANQNVVINALILARSLVFTERGRFT